MGQLLEAVNGLKETRAEHTGKFEVINDKLEKINRTIYAATLIIALAGGIIGIFGKAVVDRMWPVAQPSAQQQPQVVTQPDPTAIPSPTQNRR